MKLIFLVLATLAIGYSTVASAKYFVQCSDARQNVALSAQSETDSKNINNWTLKVYGQTLSGTTPDLPLKMSSILGLRRKQSASPSKILEKSAFVAQLEGSIKGVSASKPVNLSETVICEAEYQN